MPVYLVPFDFKGYVCVHADTLTSAVEIARKNAWEEWHRGNVDLDIGNVIECKTLADVQRIDKTFTAEDGVYGSQLALGQLLDTKGSVTVIS